MSESAPTPVVTSRISMIAKWGGRRIALADLDPSMDVAGLKSRLTEATGVLAKRQKLVGLSLRSGLRSALPDSSRLSELRRKPGVGGPDRPLQFILMGTVEADIFVDPGERDGLPEVADDFDSDFAAGTDEWHQHVAVGQNLVKFTASTTVHIMNAPRPGFPLLVLDLDHTLLDFSRGVLQRSAGTEDPSETLKRPYMDEFLARAYRKYDMVVWSQTSWRWLETKLTELGMVTNPRYKFCFVLDKTSMFSVTSTKRNTGATYTHQVKPLEIIWKKFPQYNWGAHNTLHVDDLSRNFALNTSCGLKVKAYYRKKDLGKTDVELQALSQYIERLADEVEDFEEADFRYWADVVQNKMALLSGHKSSEQK